MAVAWNTVAAHIPFIDLLLYISFITVVWMFIAVPVGYIQTELGCVDKERDTVKVGC